MLQLDDLIASYPSSDDPKIQTIISGKREFREVGSKAKEEAPAPGEYYNNQKFLVRYMRLAERLLITWETGTGKTCGIAALAEYYHRLYLQNPKTAPIKRTFILTRKSLVDDFKIQVACRCTKGEYLTPTVIDATTESVRKSNLSRELSKWYTIKSYGSFSKEIANLNDEQLKVRYSRCLFFVDESHNIISLAGEKEGTSKKKSYRNIFNLFHVIDNSKVVLATATPMVNEVKEIAPLMNLILPLDNQMPERDYTADDIDELEPYFRGRVSYVRAADTGINVINVGEEVVLAEFKDHPIKLNLDSSVMGDIQLEGYQNAAKKEDGIYSDQRQASLFVFPDGSWGGKFPRLGKSIKEEQESQTSGLGKYVKSSKANNYVVESSLKPWLVSKEGDENQPSLARLSCIYDQVIQEIKSGVLGTVFIYNEFVFGSGTIIQGLTLEANGFSRYRPQRTDFKGIEEQALPPLCSSRTGELIISLSKKLRYATITSETTPAQLARILTLFNSPDNVNGEYIKVIIGSEISKEGLNLYHVTQIHLVTNWWHRSGNYQAISRGIRATSQLLLLQQERERFKREGKNPADAVVNVYIHRHAALPHPDDYAGSVNYYIYQRAEEKDYAVRQMERLIKRVAVDCWINLNRNIRVTDIDYSSDCDYSPCNYDCYSPEAEYIDEETFDVYYIHEVVSQVEEEISNLFADKFSLTRDNIYDLLGGAYRRSEIDRALSNLVSQHTVIYNRYGYMCYLQEDNHTFFLQYGFPTTQYGQAIDIYNRDLVATEEISIPVYISIIEMDTQNRLIELINSAEEESPQLEAAISELVPENIVRVFEDAVADYFINDKVTPGNSAVIASHFKSLFILDKDQAEELKKSLSSAKKNLKATADRVPGEVIELNIDDIPAAEDIILIHNLYNTIFNRVSYTVTTKFKRGTGHLRILIPSQSNEWRDLLPDEANVYGAIVEKVLADRLNPLEERGIYGFHLGDNKFRIRDSTTEVKEKKEKSDARYTNRGRVCIYFNKSKLIEILWKLGIPSKGNLPKTADLKDYLAVKMKINKGEMEDWDRDRLEYYARWEEFGGKQDLCNEIEKYFAENNLLVT